MVPDVEENGWRSFEDYPRCPGMTSIDCDQSTVEKEAANLKGGSGTWQRG